MSWRCENIFLKEKKQNYGTDILVIVLVCIEPEKERKRKKKKQGSQRKNKEASNKEGRVFLRTGFSPVHVGSGLLATLDPSPTPAKPPKWHSEVMVHWNVKGKMVQI